MRATQLDRTSEPDAQAGACVNVQPASSALGGTLPDIAPVDFRGARLRRDRQGSPVKRGAAAADRLTSLFAQRTYFSPLDDTKFFLTRTSLPAKYAPDRMHLWAPSLPERISCVQLTKKMLVIGTSNRPSGASKMTVSTACTGRIPPPDRIGSSGRQRMLDKLYAE